MCFGERERESEKEREREEREKRERGKKERKFKGRSLLFDPRINNEYKRYPLNTFSKKPNRLITPDRRTLHIRLLQHACIYEPCYQVDEL